MDLDPSYGSSLPFVTWFTGIIIIYILCKEKVRLVTLVDAAPALSGQDRRPSTCTLGRLWPTRLHTQTSDGSPQSLDYFCSPQSIDLFV